MKTFPLICLCLSASMAGSYYGASCAFRRLDQPRPAQAPALHFRGSRSGLEKQAPAQAPRVQLHEPERTVPWTQPDTGTIHI